jgi:hypothetical protein
MRFEKPQDSKNEQKKGNPYLIAAITGTVKAIVLLILPVGVIILQSIYSGWSEFAEKIKAPTLLTLAVIFLFGGIILFVMLLYQRKQLLSETEEFKNKNNELQKQLSKELTPHLNVMWDKNLEPFCPRCGNLLRYTPKDDKVPHCRCDECEQYFYFTTDDYMYLTKDEARKYIKGEEIVRTPPVVDAWTDITESNNNDNVPF